MLPGVSAPSPRPALLQLLQMPGQFKGLAVLGAWRLLPLPRRAIHQPPCLPPPPLLSTATTLLVTAVAAIAVTITVPQAPDAVAKPLAGEPVPHTPGGWGHRAVRLLQAGAGGQPAPGRLAGSLVEQSSSHAALGSRELAVPICQGGLDGAERGGEGQEPETTGWGLISFRFFLSLFCIYLF